MEVGGTCSAVTAAALPRQVRANHPEPMSVIWDHNPAHQGAAWRSPLATPDLNLRLVPWPGYSPDFNADEAIGDWIREGVTVTTCLGTTGKVREQVGAFRHALSTRTADVKRLCRAVLQAQADALATTSTGLVQAPQHGEPTLALL